MREKKQMAKEKETKEEVTEQEQIEQPTDPMEIIKQLQNQINVMQLALLNKPVGEVVKTKPVIKVEHGTQKFKGLVR
jgi:hypothetical protein